MLFWNIPKGNLERKKNKYFIRNILFIKFFVYIRIIIKQNRYET